MPRLRQDQPREQKLKDKGSNAYPEERKAEILAAYHERGSMRAMTRIFGVNRNTVLAWLKKSREPAVLKKDAGEGQEA